MNQLLNTLARKRAEQTELGSEIEHIKECLRVTEAVWQLCAMLGAGLLIGAVAGFTVITNIR